LEDGVAVDDFGAAELRDRGVEYGHTGLERAGELLALLEQHLAHTLLLGDELRISLAHHLHKSGHEVVKKRGALAELGPMAHRAPRDAAQHIAAALIRRNNPVDDEEAARADVVRDHAQRRILVVGGTKQTRSLVD